MPSKSNRNRMANMAAMAANLRSYLLTHPDQTVEEIGSALNMKPAVFYSLLSGLADDPEICQQDKFPVLTQGKHLTTEDVNSYLAALPEQDGGPPRLPERLLYLYCSLHNAIPCGGLSMEEIETNYVELMMQSGGHVPEPSALRRMIFRDLNELEKIEIAIDRPSTGSPRYCLKENYLPKLTPDSAAIVYTSMLLYRDTLLDEAMAGARSEIEKAFFRNYPERSRILQERIHIVGDTLANPRDFGNNLGKLIRAVCESFRIRVVYLDNQGTRTDRVLEPLGLVYKRGVWYLIARLPENGEYRTYRVDQMLQLYPRENDTFPYPEGFTLLDHIGDSWGVYHNDEVQTVRLKFSPAVAHRVQHLCYHRSQKIVDNAPDGSVIIEFRACGLMELQSWVLQWGTQVEVLEPLSLRESVAATAREIAAINQD